MLATPAPAAFFPLSHWRLTISQWLPSRAHFREEAPDAPRWMSAQRSQQAEPRGASAWLHWEVTWDRIHAETSVWLLPWWRIASRKRRRVCWASVPFLCPMPHGTCCAKPSRGVGARQEHLLTLGKTWTRKEGDRVQEVVEKGLDTGHRPPVRHPDGQGWDEGLFCVSGDR